jgi:hypothetical protein
MDEFEQRFIVKHFHLKGWGNNKITAELETTFQGSALSKATVKRWLQKFKTGDLLCSDQPGPIARYRGTADSRGRSYPSLMRGSPSVSKLLIRSRTGSESF